MRTVYVNGNFVTEDEARISVFDRALLFADAIYEVSAVINGRLVDNDAHIARMHRSLGELDMRPPVSDEALKALQRQLLEKNNLEEGWLYWQISRGAEQRDFDYGEDLEPSLVMFTQSCNLLDAPKARSGISVKTIEDIRWQRRDIKTTMLLAQSLAKKQATRAGFDDAWMVEDGVVTEGSSNNAYIVTDDGKIVTRPATSKILNGITRRAVNRLAEENGLQVEERTFTVDEAKSAAEAFSTSASTFVMPVVRIDEATLGDGKPGPLSTRLRELYLEIAASE